MKTLSQTLAKTTDLTIKDAQRLQPWTLPYYWTSSGQGPHARRELSARHALLHAQKSLGKIAAVYERMDHQKSVPLGPDTEQFMTIADMSADLMAVALRFANLYGFDLETELRRRVLKKNDKGYPECRSRFYLRPGTPPCR